MFEVKVKKLRPEAELPLKVARGSVGADLKIYFDKEDGEQIKKVVLQPNQSIKASTGIAVEIPEDYFMDIRPRSSAGIKKDLFLKNTTGVIDADYRGEILLFIKNIGDKAVTLEHGERVAQAIILPNYDVKYVEVEELSDTERGAGGFGSTGRK